jgi:hypothetical protein
MNLNLKLRSCVYEFHVVFEFCLETTKNYMSHKLVGYSIGISLHVANGNGWESLIMTYQTIFSSQSFHLSHCKTIVIGKLFSRNKSYWSLKL